MRKGPDIVVRQQWILQLNRGRREHRVVPCISLTPPSTARENSNFAAKAKESINSVQEPHSKIVNQPLRAPTTQSSIDSSKGVSEIENFAVNLVLVISEYSTRLRKKLQCLRGRILCLHCNINEFLSEPCAIIRDTHSRGIQ